jgi:hypothetical protein
VAIAALSLIAVGGGAAVAAANGAFPGGPHSDPTGTPSATPTDDGTAAPATDETAPSPSATQGPDATGPAAFGLCTAFTAGGPSSDSVAYTALLNASSSAGSITDYCAPILATGGSAGHKPTSHPTHSAEHGQSGDDHGTGTPASHGH